MDFIDTHQHLIFRDRISYGWTNDLPALAAGNFTLKDYKALTNGRGIGKTVFMETGVDDADYQAEARLVAGLVGTEGLAGVIASCRPETDTGFDAWLNEAQALGINGFRRILHVAPDDVSRSAIFRKNLRKIGKAGLPFDLCFFARQHPITIELLKACPDQQFVLDHCGNPDVASGAFAPWAQSMRQLAAFPNLAVKLSGIAVNCAPGTANLATIKPYFDHMMECFGPERIVWGSDWPVVNLACGLQDWIDISQALISSLTESEQRAIAQDNALHTYRISKEK
ncbi:MAG: amidohydrolase [Rhizobiaceae bacterium]